MNCFFSSSQCAISFCWYADDCIQFLKGTGSCKTGNHACWLCSIAAIKMPFILSCLKRECSVRVQISGWISNTPISVAFSKNHSKRLAFFNNEIAILIFLAGGASQYETFDPKPDAPVEIRGPWSPIPTNVPGTFICEKLPLMAQRMDKVAVIRSTTEAISAGIVYVPEDRGKQGAVKGLPIFQNVTLPSLGRTSRSGFLRLAEEFKLAREYTQRLDLRAASLDQDVGLLSGGNQQKVVIAKWLATHPRVIILDEPTKGIDIGSKAAVHEFMAELAAQGLAVIMVSSEIPEILGMSDRVIVMREGRMVAEVSGAQMTPEALVRAAAGIGEAA